MICTSLRRLLLAGSTGLFALVIIATPAQIETESWAFELSAAMAKSDRAGGANAGGNGRGRDGNNGGGGHASAGANHDGAKGNPPDHANIASRLGSLNAAHASPTALENASAKSNVGRIAAYKAARIAADEAQDAADAAQANADDQQAAADVAQAAADEAQAAADEDPNNQDLQDAAEAAQAAADEAQAAADEAQAAADTAQDAADAAEAESDAALDEAAINREVTDEVETAVRGLLGIPRDR
jgi:chemotaxis protein histidine kinase CheA